MRNYITIDGGTTNTRLTLMDDGEVLGTRKLPVGARKSMNGNGELKRLIGEAIASLLHDAKITESELTAVIASGMITCEFGLINLPHLSAPAGLKELHDGLCTVSMPEIVGVPITFVRGVKTVGDLESTDMMRGEETELMGIASPKFGKCVFVLPGSHSKLIYTDTDGRITHFSTTLTGEMLASLSEGTILKDAVSLDCSQTDNEYLERGFDYAEAKGLNEALFKTRILKNIFGKGPVECYSFFLGAVLADEIRAILKSDVQTVVIGGRRQIKEATAHLVESRSDKAVITLDEKTVDLSTALGMIRIFEA